MTVQVKLLRVLEDRTILPVGGLKPRPVDVRFIAATNRDLELESEQGTFRRNGITFRIPPLRERPSEIVGLAEQFITRATLAMGRTTAPKLGDEALRILHAYRWPGNIRELRNVIERAVLLCGDRWEIGPQ